MKPLLAVLRGRSGFAAVAQTGFATALVLGINVATGVLSARFLGAEGRGELAALLLCPQVVSFLFTLGLPLALIVSVKNRPAAESELMGAALALAALMGGVAVLAGYLAIPWLLAQYDASVVTVARWFLAGVLLGVPATVLMAALQLRDRFVAYNRVRYWQSALVLAGLIGLAAANVANPVWWGLAYLAPAVPFFLWLCWWAARAFRPSLTALRANGTTLLGRGLRVHAVDALGTALGQVDKVILIAVLAPSLFGVYVVAFNLSRLITTFASSVVPVLLPRTAGKPAAEVLASTARSLSATMALAFLGVLGFTVLGALILNVLYGAEFRAGYWTLVILAVEAALASGAVILQQPYLVMNEAGTIAAFQAVSLCIAAAFVYALGRELGMEGAAAGLLIATSVRLFLTYRAYRRLFGTAAPRLVPAWSDCMAIVSKLRAGPAA